MCKKSQWTVRADVDALPVGALTATLLARRVSMLGMRLGKGRLCFGFFETLVVLHVPFEIKKLFR
jgi:hypothetical protein